MFDLKKLTVATAATALLGSAAFAESASLTGNASADVTTGTAQMDADTRASANTASANTTGNATANTSAETAANSDDFVPAEPGADRLLATEAAGGVVLSADAQEIGEIDEVRVDADGAKRVIVTLDDTLDLAPERVVLRTATDLEAGGDLRIPMTRDELVAAVRGEVEAGTGARIE